MLTETIEIESNDVDSRASIATMEYTIACEIEASQRREDVRLAKMRGLATSTRRASYNLSTAESRSIVSGDDGKLYPSIARFIASGVMTPVRVDLGADLSDVSLADLLESLNSLNAWD